jgi:hypothetical protein
VCRALDSSVGRMVEDLWRTTDASVELRTFPGSVSFRIGRQGSPWSKTSSSCRAPSRSASLDFWHPSAVLSAIFLKFYYICYFYASMQLCNASAQSLKSQATLKNPDGHQYLFRCLKPPWQETETKVAVKTFKIGLHSSLLAPAIRSRHRCLSFSM